MPDLRPSDDDRCGPGRLELRADCGRCFGLCCVAPAFAASADFAIDKPAGQACPNLRPDFGCGIHDELRPRGFRGCAVYDCFGAGQRVAQVTFGGRDWRSAPHTAAGMFAVFAVMRQLHELLWYLTEALALPAAQPLHAQLSHSLAETEQLTRGSPSDLLALDLPAHRRPVGDLLGQASELTRTAYLGRTEPPRATSRGRARIDPHSVGRTRAGRTRAGRAGADLQATDLTGTDLTGTDLTGTDLTGTDLTGTDLTGTDLTGTRLRGRDLRGASLRGACLIAADLRGADLRCADLLGADLRDADLHGANLADAIFLTQAQLDAARGGTTTRLPGTLTRPAHWPREA